MDYTLGIDVGTNSVGWAIVENDKKVVDAGVRIFSEGVNEEKYKKSYVEESKNIRRRDARGARRRYFRYQLRRELLKKKLADLGMLPDTFSESPLELYGLRAKGLNEKIPLQKIGRIFLLINKRRGFESNRKSMLSDSAKQRSEYYSAMEENKRKVEESGARTIGEYFYNELRKGNPLNDNPYEPAEKIRDRFIYRNHYKEEFDKIWKKQAEYYPEVLTAANKRVIRDEIIFYVRPLKSQKHLVSKCRFEPNKRVAPKSSPWFQKFRIWQTINNIRVDDSYGIFRELSLGEKQALFELLNKSREVTHSGIKKVIGLSTSASMNDLPPKIKGNTTYSGILKALGEDNFNKLDEEKLFLLWEKLYYADSREWLYSNLTIKNDYPAEIIERLCDIGLEDGYGNISTKAIKEILPYLEEGEGYDKACEKAGYRHSDFFRKDEELPELSEVIPTGDKNSVLSFILNPLVKKSVSEAIKVINAVIKSYGKPSKLRIELSRELKLPKQKREERLRKNRQVKELRDSYEKFLSERFHFNKVTRGDILKFELWLELEHSPEDLNKLNPELSESDFRKFALNVNPKDKTKFSLWLECGRKSPYTGKIIPLYKLFSNDYEVEHILPYSLSLDDSFSNKTLVEREINRLKGNKTAAEYFSSNQAEFDLFEKRISVFPKTKKEKLKMRDVPEGFRANQLTNNSFIGIALKRKCMEAIRDVEVTNGQTTSKLRHYWGLNTILNQDESDKKYRGDHRHHSIDAIVIALTTPRFIQILSTAYKFNVIDTVVKSKIPLPYDNFRDEVKAITDTMLVSHRKEKRLLTSKINKYIHRNSQSNVFQKTKSVRGQLHEETFYGKILNPYSGMEEFVYRKKLSDLDEKQIFKIVDKPIQKLIIDIANSSGKSIKEVLNSELIQRNISGKGVRIKNVRITAKDKNLFPVKINGSEGEYFTRYVKPGNNFIANIYKDDRGKLQIKVLSLMEAVSRKLKGEKLVEEIEGWQFLHSISQDDIVLLQDDSLDLEEMFNNPEYIFENLYKITKFSINEKIGILKHCVANNDYRLEKSFRQLPFIKVKVDILGKISGIG